MLAWLVWNPDRVLFTLPFLHHPIAIYGAWFAAGFILGYFILVHMFKRVLAHSPLISSRDIGCWPTLIRHLVNAFEKPKHPLQSVVQHLSLSLRTTLSQFKYMQEANQPQKEALLNALNRSGFHRSELEELLPKALITSSQFGYLLTDRLTWFVVLGTIIGARLGHVFFYDWPHFQQHPENILKIWQGGLASHGGVLGVLLAVLLYTRVILKNFPEITFLGLIDCMVIPSGLVACFIRIGNFFNQEIVGPETQLPWAVVFGNPMEGAPWVPRHPTQLYEALAYLSIFLFLGLLWHYKHTRLKSGTLSGLFFSLLFSARFLIEFVKLPQSSLIDESFLQMGQYLSIPFIFFGFFLLFWGQRKQRGPIEQRGL